MFICHLDTEAGFRGGQQQVLWLMEGLRAHGVQQRLLTAKGSDLARRAAEAGLEVVELAQSRPWHPSAWKAVALAARGQNTLVHAHASHAHRLAWHAVGGRVPIVVTRRVDFPVGRNWFSRRVYRGEAQHYIAISNAIRDLLISGGVSPSKVRVVHSGVRPERLAKHGGAAVRRELGLTGASPLIGCTAALVDHKDPLNLVEALILVRHELPQAAVLWAGEGNLRSTIQERATHLGVDKDFVLAGWRGDVGAILDAIDLFVMPSHLEGLCTSLIDAQALGIPCVATRAGGIPDIITEGVNGLLVPPRDPAVLAEAIISLWRDETLRVKFAAQGPTIVRERFSVEQMVEGNLQTYREVLGRTPSAS
jgi:glycosyltransferase involved in cell wall biosynthesis